MKAERKELEALKAGTAEKIQRLRFSMGISMVHGPIRTPNP
jgi:hypothetical protein